jgi:hypothetical protein
VVGAATQRVVVVTSTSTVTGHLDETDVVGSRHVEGGKIEMAVVVIVSVQESEVVDLHLGGYETNEAVVIESGKRDVEVEDLLLPLSPLGVCYVAIQGNVSKVSKN